MASQQAQCVRLVVDALLEGRFSKVSVVLHMYEALQALIHDPQVWHTCTPLCWQHFLHGLHVGSRPSASLWLEASTSSMVEADPQVLLIAGV